MHEENAEKAKASRDLRILIICVIVGVGLPLVLFFMTHVRSGP
jgi:flagellar basal body-associated protein FliL